MTRQSVGRRCLFRLHCPLAQFILSRVVQLTLGIKKNTRCFECSIVATISCFAISAYGLCCGKFTVDSSDFSLNRGSISPSILRWEKVEKCDSPLKLTHLNMQSASGKRDELGLFLKILFFVFLLLC